MFKLLIGRPIRKREVGYIAIAGVLIITLLVWMEMKHHTFSSFINEESLSHLEAFFVNSYEARPILTTLLFILFYVVIVVVPFPVGVVMMLGGILYGPVWGMVINLGLSILSAGASFLLTRYCFHDFVQRQFEGQLRLINRETQKRGFWYVALLRVGGNIPFYAVNHIMPLTKVSFGAYLWGSFIGLLGVVLFFTQVGAHLFSVTELLDQWVHGIYDWVKSIF